MTTLEDYKILADVYDILNPKEDVLDQKGFFETVVKRHNVQSVLDCACGTGWHLSMFHDMGLKASGSDISPEMLALAKINLEGKYIPLKKEDFRSLGNSWGENFEMITCLTTSLPHMLTDEDIILALTSMYNRLSPGGVLVVTSGITDALLNNKPKFIPARILSDEAFYFVMEYPENQLIFNVVYIRKTPDSFEEKFTSLTYNAMRRSVLERCFGKTEFKKVDYYGDYDFSPYDPTVSSKLIIVAEK
jgi:glycine/sarcosine N-methyltransferase